MRRRTSGAWSPRPALVPAMTRTRSARPAASRIAAARRSGSSGRIGSRDGAAAGLPGLGLEHDRVRVGELADRELRRGRAQLVARRQDRDDRRAADRELGVAGGGGEREVHRPEPAARREHELSGRDVLADAAHVLAGGDRCVDQHGVVAVRQALARDHRVAPGGQRVAGVDDVERPAGQAQRIGVARRARVGARDGDAVHRRRGERGRRAPRPDRLRGHAAEGVLDGHADDGQQARAAAGRRPRGERLGGRRRVELRRRGAGRGRGHAGYASRTRSAPV